MRTKTVYTTDTDVTRQKSIRSQILLFFQLVGTYFLFCDTHFRADTDKSNCRMHPNKHKTSLHLFVSVVILYSFTLVCNTLQVKDDACKEGLTDSKHGWHGDNPLRKTLLQNHPYEGRSESFRLDAPDWITTLKILRAERDQWRHLWIRPESILK